MKKQMHSKWKRLSGRYNACLALNHKGQLELLAHVQQRSEIDTLCQLLAEGLKREWDIQEARRQKQAPDKHETQHEKQKDFFRSNSLLNENSKPAAVRSFAEIPLLTPVALNTKESA